MGLEGTDVTLSGVAPLNQICGGPHFLARRLTNFFLFFQDVKKGGTQFTNSPLKYTYYLIYMISDTLAETSETMTSLSSISQAV